jgi:tetratricopeptide (TPR) repeat protein
MMTAVNGYHLYQGPSREPHAQTVADWMACAAALAYAERFDEALEYLDRSLELMPRSPQLRWNRGHVLLAVGKYPEGFSDFQWGRYLFGDLLGKSGIPLWTGESLA